MVRWNSFAKTMTKRIFQKKPWIKLVLLTADFGLKQTGSLNFLSFLDMLLTPRLSLCWAVKLPRRINVIKDNLIYLSCCCFASCSGLSSKIGELTGSVISVCTHKGRISDFQVLWGNLIICSIMTIESLPSPAAESSATIGKRTRFERP